MNSALFLKPSLNVTILCSLLLLIYINVFSFDEEDEKNFQFSEEDCIKSQL